MNIVIIGGGASGMMAGILLGEKGHQVTLVEQNEKLGKKLYITGKGRCNFTNDCSENEFLDAVLTNPRFMYSALGVMNPQDTIALFEKWGLRTKVERGRRAFPASDKSADVLDMLKRKLKDANVRVLLDTRCTRISFDGSGVNGVYIEKAARKTEREAGVHRFEEEKFAGAKETFLNAERVIVATGGISYRSTGATGDGYRFAKEAGLKVTETRPSLVPIVCAEEYIRDMQGLSLKNVSLIVKSGKKVLFEEQGELMFTHFGITGPLVLSASGRIGGLIGKKPLTSYIDLKPAVTEEMLDKRFLSVFAENQNRTLVNALSGIYPSGMLPVIPAAAGISPEKRVHDLTRADREALITATKRFPLTFTSLRSFEEAVVTQGGVSVKEIDPRSFEAKKVRGLYFTGEVLDLDALTGGYNLQIAWSTAAACAENME